MSAHSSDHASHTDHSHSTGHESTPTPETSHDFMLETPPVIEPAGFINDLSPSNESNLIDLSEFFPVREVVVVHHNTSLTIRDMIPGNTLPKIDLSRKLILQIKNRATPELFDLYPESLFRPTLLETFTKNARLPRIRYIGLAKTLPEFPENSLDIRTLSPRGFRGTHPDIYSLDLPISGKIRRFHRQHRRLVRNSSLIALGSLATLFLTIGWLGYIAEGALRDGYERLAQLPSLSSTPEKFSQEIQAIDASFARASYTFAPLHFLSRTGIFPSEKLRNATYAIDGGRSVGRLLTEIDELRSELISGVPPQIIGSLGYFDIRIVTQTDTPLTDFWKSHRKALQDIKTHLSESAFAFSSITSLGDPVQDTQVRKGADILKIGEKGLWFVLDHETSLFEILGDTVPKKYLILNQNRDELRANGGFPGSAVEINLYKGRITSTEKRDIYFYDWHLFPHGETPPPGIDQITSVYGIRDANYSPDFSKSFETIGRMIEKSGGSTLDGLIAINQWLIHRLLEVTGPIQIPGRSEVFTADNFSVLISLLVEAQIGRETTAKDILFDFMTAFEKRLVEVGAYSAYLEIILSEIQKGEVLFAHRDSKSAEFIESYIPNSPYLSAAKEGGNFIYPVFTSLSGNKSDRYMNRVFTLESRPSSASGWLVTRSTLSPESNSPKDTCRVDTTLTLKSSHRFEREERESLRKMLYEYQIDPKEHEHELFVQGNGDNVQYLRLLVPKWSVVLSGSGGTNVPVVTYTSDHEEADVLALTVKTSVNQDSITKVRYQSPVQNCQSEVRFIKQPGLQNFSITTR